MRCVVGSISVMLYACMCGTSAEGQGEIDGDSLLLQNPSESNLLVLHLRLASILSHIGSKCSQINTGSLVRGTGGLDFIQFSF